MAISGTYAFSQKHVNSFVCNLVLLYTVYKATNTVNGNFYVGISTNVKQRMANHFIAARAGGKTPFYRAIRKYGCAVFVFTKLGSFYNKEEAAQAEIDFINLLQPKYNLKPGGGGIRGVEYAHVVKDKKPSVWLGKKHTLETRKLQRAARLGKPGNAFGKRSDEIKARMSIASALNPTRHWLGKTRTEQTKEKIRVTKKGAITPQACIDALKKHQVAARELAAQKRRKPVICLTDGKLYSCIREACAHYGIKYHNMCAAIKYPYKIQGLSFAYVRAQNGN